MKTLIINITRIKAKYNLIILFSTLLMIGIYTDSFNGLKSMLVYTMFCIL